MLYGLQVPASWIGQDSKLSNNHYVLPSVWPVLSVCLSVCFCLPYAANLPAKPMVPFFGAAKWIQAQLLSTFARYGVLVRQQLVQASIRLVLFIRRHFGDAAYVILLETIL
jgi:hypothetical protein